LKGELIGQDIKITKAKNKSLINIEGKIIDETKNTILLSTKKGDKKIIKDQIEFDLFTENKVMKIDGKSIVSRPEDRIKKRTK